MRNTELMIVLMVGVVCSAVLGLFMVRRFTRAFQIVETHYRPDNLERERREGMSRLHDQAQATAGRSDPTYQRRVSTSLDQLEAVKRDVEAYRIDWARQVRRVGRWPIVGAMGISVPAVTVLVGAWLKVGPEQSDIGFVVIAVGMNCLAAFVAISMRYFPDRIGGTYFAIKDMIDSSLRLESSDLDSG
jgi:hypothetical protein